MDKIARIRAKIEKRINELDKDKYINIDAKACRVSELSFLKRFLDTLSEDPELVRHPPIAYIYPSDASRDEQLKMALLALLNSDLIKVAGNKFTKQDLIDWVEKQKEQKPEGVQGDKGDPGLPGIEAVEGVVHHVMNAHYIVTNQKQLLREIPEGTVVKIFICKAKEDQK